MKKMFLFAILFSLVSGFSVAQQPQQANPMLQKLPVDPNVRMGKLENGMTYYIYRNEKPKGLADFYILHNIGAIDEDDHQNGLAHFLEHMAFNGTKRLPGKMLLDYFQANGVEFGSDINAMTGMDNTQYLISNVPTKVREGIIDTAIIAIADWSGGVALKHAEIDNERGVILEEKRTGSNAQRRMAEAYFPTLFNNTKYNERSVIGTEEILKNFKYSDIEDFYHKWYHPDQQAVIVVGDIDVDAIEAKIKKVMGAIPANKVATPKQYVNIPEYAEDKVCIVKDKECTSTSAMMLNIINLFPKEQNDTPLAVLKSFITSTVSSIFNERISDLSKKIDAPFLGGGMDYSSLSAKNDIVSFSIASQEGKLATAMEAFTKEIKRLKTYGVTEDEVERVKKNFMESIQNSYDNRADRKNKSIVNMFIGNFFSNDAMLTPEMSYQISKSIVGQLNAQMINQSLPMILPEKKTAIIVTVPDKEGAVPTEATIMNSFKAGFNAQVEAPKEEKIDRPLIAKEPKAVKVKKTSKDELGNTVWTLANGAKVVVKPTTFRQDEIIFSATGDGGSNMFKDNEMIDAQILPSVLSVSGLGSFTATELGKVLAGKNASVGKSINSFSHGIGGNSTKKDLETMFKLLYLSYTDQPFREEDHQLVNKMLASKLENMEKQPGYIFQKEVTKLLYGDDPRVVKVSKDNYQQAKLSNMKAMHDRLFDGVNGMTFVFVGSIDEATLKPLVEKYIASLPKGAKKTKKPASDTDIKKGKINEKIAVEMATPKVTCVNMLYTDEMKSVSIKDNLAFGILKDILDVKYTKSIREEMGATYGVGVSNSISREPRVRYSLDVSYDTNEKQADETVAQVIKEIEEIANGNSSISDEIKISKGATAKNYEKGINSSNSMWLNFIASLHKTGDNYPENYLKSLEAVNENDIRTLAGKLLKSGNIVELQMVPKK